MDASQRVLLQKKKKIQTFPNTWVLHLILKVSRLNIRFCFTRQQNSAAWPQSWPESCFPWSEASLYRPTISLFKRRKLWLEARAGADLPGSWDLLQKGFESAIKIKTCSKCICMVLNCFYIDLFLLIKCMLNAIEGVVPAGLGNEFVFVCKE